MPELGKDVVAGSANFLGAAGLALELRRSNAALETVDIAAVEVLSTGGPVRGVGSPPEGDFWTREQLEGIAAANRDLAAQVKPPNKVGHSDAQTLVKNSALAAVSPGEMPAVGWLDGATARVVDGEGGVDAVLVMDAKQVPKKFSQLVDVGAYRTRSAELSRITDQVTQKTYDWVVTGLAWLGAKLPAVQTLEDVVALYELDQVGELPDDVRAYIVYAAAEGTVVWSPDSSFQSLRDDVGEALNGPATGGDINPRFWVQDVAVGGDRALVVDNYGDWQEGWVVPFTRSADGTVAVAPSSDWTTVEQGWVATAKEYERKIAAGAESVPMPELTLTDEQAAALREQLSVEGEEVTADQLVEAATARANELADAKAKADEADKRKLEADDATGKLGALEKRFEASERRLFEAGRDSDIAKAMREKRLDPEGVEKWEKRYEDLGADTARELLFELPVNEELKTFGSDERGGDEDEVVTKEYEAEISRNAGVPVEELI